MKHFVNWNVNGIRSIIKKDFVKDVEAMNPDVLCLQETKAGPEESRSALELLKGYHVIVNCSKARKGYSGTAILSKEEPMNVSCDIGVDEFDQEGRVITAEYATYFIVILLGSCYIDRLMCNVEITTHDHRFSFVQPQQVFPEFKIPLLAPVES